MESAHSRCSVCISRSMKLSTSCEPARRTGAAQQSFWSTHSMGLSADLS
jgi:hypothetical protein